MMMEVLIKDIREILPSKFDFIVSMSPIGIDITFAEEVYEPQTIIITYGSEGFVYLNLMSMDWTKDVDYGFDLEELKAIYDVANYLEINKEYVIKLMECF